MKKALVLGAGGFIGSHLVKRLKEDGYWVRGVDLNYPEFWETVADEFIIGDLRDDKIVSLVMYSPNQNQERNDPNGFDEVYQLAADMGGAGYLFTGEHDSDIMHNSMQINLNVLKQASRKSVKRLFYASSACVYPEYNQLDPQNPKCTEDSTYPAQPDSEYGWEKLFSERMYMAFERDTDLQVRVGRFHGIFGPYGTWNGGKEKAPAALCRKVAKAEDGNEIEIWGDGEQTRSFLYIDEAIESTIRFMRQDISSGPVNIGSEEMVSINEFVDMVCKIDNKTLVKKHIEGPQGVRGRNSDNTLLEKLTGWKPTQDLQTGITKLYDWIKTQL